MTEELKPVEGAEVKTPVEGEQQQEAPKYTALEEKALAQGWKPKDEWDGDPEDYRDARTYIDRGELLGKLKTQNNELKEVKTMLSYMSEHNKKVYTAGYERAIVDLKAQRIAAMKDENFEAVAAIEEAIDQNKDALNQIKRQPPAVQAPVQDKALADEWLSKNSWYKTDTSLKHWANGMAVDYARVNPGVTEAEIYSFLAKEVRKEFPHKFRKQGAPSPDGEGRGTGGGGTKATTSGEFDKLMATFDEDEARMAKALVKSGALTKEKYVEDYKSLQRS